MALALAAGASAEVAHIHGRIVKIDPARGTFLIHHDPFPAMPMAMTMEVAPKHRAELKKLHAGEIVDATVDIAVEPWIGTDIHPVAK
jgi:Cu/Ag efflux protein CusF